MDVASDSRDFDANCTAAKAPVVTVASTSLNAQSIEVDRVGPSNFVQFELVRRWHSLGAPDARMLRALRIEVTSARRDLAKWASWRAMFSSDADHAEVMADLRDEVGITTSALAAFLARALRAARRLIVEMGTMAAHLRVGLDGSNESGEAEKAAAARERVSLASKLHGLPHVAILVARTTTSPVALAR